MAIRQETKQVEEIDSFPEKAARLIIDGVQETANQRTLNYLHTLSEEWRGHPDLDTNIVGLGRLSLEVCLGLDEGSFYSDSTPSHIDYVRLRPVLEDYFDFNFDTLNRTSPQTKINLILKALGEIVINQTE